MRVGYWSHGYYYCKRRYVGTGEVAELAAALDDQERERARRERERARESDQAERQTLQEARRQAARVDALVKAGLEAAGLWRPQRHAWRRRKEVMAFP